LDIEEANQLLDAFDEAEKPKKPGALPGRRRR
jgi:hypothetical protein